MRSTTETSFKRQRVSTTPRGVYSVYMSIFLLCYLCSDCGGHVGYSDGYPPLSGGFLRSEASSFLEAEKATDLEGIYHPTHMDLDHDDDDDELVAELLAEHAAFEKRGGQSTASRGGLLGLRPW